MLGRLAKLAKFRSDSKKTTFAAFVFVLALILLIESIMDYYFPIVVEGSLGSNSAVGLIFGVTNIVALVCDFVFPRIFKNRSWYFLLIMGLFFQIGFPFFTNASLVTHIGALFIIAAVFWNIYFEFLAFARSNFVTANCDREDYARNWAIISAVISLSFVTGPILGSALLRTPMVGRITILHSLQLVALFFIIFFLPHPKPKAPEKMKRKWAFKFSVLREVGIIQTISRRISPILILGYLINSIGASIYMVGGLMGTKIFGGSGLDWIFVFLFEVASVTASFALSRVKIKHEKKLKSQILLLVGSFFLATLFVANGRPLWSAIAIFLCGLSVSFSWILNEAVYSDLSDRLRPNTLYISGMERMNDSLGYMTAPIIIGFLADRSGYLNGLATVGVACFVACFLLILITPRKLKLPQKDLDKLA